MATIKGIKPSARSAITCKFCHLSWSSEVFVVCPLCGYEVDQCEKIYAHTNKMYKFKRNDLNYFKKNVDKVIDEPVTPEARMEIKQCMDAIWTWIDTGKDVAYRLIYFKIKKLQVVSPHVLPERYSKRQMAFLLLNVWRSDKVNETVKINFLKAGLKQFIDAPYISQQAVAHGGRESSEEDEDLVDVMYISDDAVSFANSHFTPETVRWYLAIQYQTWKRMTETTESHWTDIDPRFFNKFLTWKKGVEALTCKETQRTRKKALNASKVFLSQIFHAEFIVPIDFFCDNNSIEDLINYVCNLCELSIRPNPPAFDIFQYSFCKAMLLELIRELDVPIGHSGVDETDQMEQQENTTFSDQRELVVDQGYTTNQLETTLQSLSMAEPEWHVRNILRKPIPVWSGAWSTGDQQGKVLQMWDLPKDMLLGIHYNQLATFTFFRGHPRVRFQINGTKFHCGRLLAVFVPYTPGNEKNQQWDIFYPDTLLSAPHVMLDASMSNSGEIDLPFCHLYTYFSTLVNNPVQSLGRIYLYVFNALRAPEALSKNVSVTVFVSYDSAELHQPCHAHVPFDKKTRGHAGAEGLLKGGISMLTDLAAPEMKLMGNVAGLAANFDKPDDPIEMRRWVPNAISSLSYGEGMNTSTRLSLVPGTFTVPDAQIIATTEDDMNLLNLCKIPNCVNRSSWLTTQAERSEIMHIPVYPTFSFKENLDTIPKTTNFAPSMLAYVSRAFKFWRGSLHYKLQIVASQMHTGRLMIAYGAGIRNLTFDQASYLNTLIVDLQERHEVEFDVPFMCEQPWLRCDQLSDVTNEPDATRHRQHVGEIKVFVLNRLAVPDTAASTIDLNLFVCAGDDFELAVPCDLTGCLGAGKKTFEFARAQSGQETVTSRTGESGSSIGKGSTVASGTAVKTMSEDAMNLKTVIRRFCHVYTNEMNATGNGFVLKFPNMPCLSPINYPFRNASLGSQNRTLLSHFSELFTFWHGSLCYKLSFTTDVEFTITVYHVPCAYVSPNFTPGKIEDCNLRTYALALSNYGTMLGVSRVQGSVEFTVPFYTPYAQLCTNSFGALMPNAREATGLIYVLFEGHTNPEKSRTQVNLFQAAGDDFCLNYLRAPPRLAFVKDLEQKREFDETSGGLYNEYPVICGLEFAPQNEEEEKVVGHTGRENEIPLTPMIRAPSLTNLLDEPPTQNAETNATAESQIHESHTAEDKNEDDDEEEVFEEAVEQRSFLTRCVDAVKPTVLTKAERTMDNVNCAIDTVREQVNCFGEQISNGTSYIMKTIEAIVDQIKTSIGGISNMKELAFDACSLVTSIYTFVKAKSITMRLISLTSVIRALFGKVLMEHVSQAVNFVLEYLGYSRNEVDERPHAQSAEDDGKSLFNLISTCLAAFGGALALKYKMKNFGVSSLRELSERLRLFNFSMTAMNNLAKLKDYVASMIEVMVDFVLSKCQPRIYAAMKLKSGFEQVEKFVEEVDELYPKYKDQLRYHCASRKRVHVLYDMAREYKELLTTCQIGLKGRVLLTPIAKVEEMYAHLKSEIPKADSRVDPYVVCLHGPSGIGKSGVIGQLMNECMNDLGYGKTDRKCALNCAEEYFSENYTNQPLIYIDDFSAFATEEQYTNFFNLKSNEKYSPNMAFNKGICFNSEVIAMTTNHPYPIPNCISDTGALWRRRNALIAMDWRDTEKRGRNVVGDDNAFRPADYSHAVFRFCAPLQPQQTISDWMSYDEMKQRLCAQMRGHFIRQYIMVEKNLRQADGKEVDPVAQFDKGQWFVDFEGINQDSELQLTGMNDLVHALAFSETECGIEIGITPDMDLEDAEYVSELMQREGWKTRLLTYVKNKDSLVQKLKSKIKGLFATLCEKISEWWKVQSVEKWMTHIRKFKRVLFVTSCVLLTIGIGKDLWDRDAAYRCLCDVDNSLYYRCVRCGKWPVLDRCVDEVKEFVLKQWSRLYGAAEYVAKKITTLAEEQRICKTLGFPVTEVMMVGTAVAHAGSAYGTHEGRGVSPSKVVAHADKQALELIENRIKRAVYRIKLNNGSVQSAVAIGERKIITPNHFWLESKDGDTFYVQMNGELIPFEYLLKNKQVVMEKDLCVLDLGPRFPQHKDLVKHFVSEKDLPYCMESPVMLVKRSSDGTTTLTESRAIGRGPVKYSVDVFGVEEEIKCCDSWSYPIVCRPGDCGSPLVVLKEAVQTGKILGIHIAGSESMSMAMLLTKEQLSPYVKESQGIPTPDVSRGDSYIVPRGHFSKVGIASDGGVFLPNKTKLLPTPMFDEIFPHETEPAVLQSHDSRLDVRPTYPLTNGIAKYGKILNPIPERDLDMCEEWISEMTNKMRPLRNLDRELTEEEIIFGIDGLEFYDRMNMRSSPGYPWVKFRKQDDEYDFENSGKRYLFDETQRCIKNKQLRKVYDVRDAAARKGDRVSSVWTDCLKDERRAMEKIVSGSTRVFTIPPVDFTLVARKYLLDFAAAVKSSYLTSFCKVGITAESLDWDFLYKDLEGWSPYCIAGDFSKFDGTIPPNVIERVKNVVKKWYLFWNKDQFVGERNNALDVIFDEFSHTVTLAKDEIYITHQGNPSGNPLTDLLNSFVNLYYISLAWLMLARVHAPELATLQDFAKFVKIVVYGDDNLISVKGAVIKWFNQVTISEALRTYSIEYTNDEKSGVTAYKNLDECTFLKRSFGVHEELGVRVPLMARRTCQELTNWIRKSPNDRLQLQENFNDALRFVYFYGKQEFLDFKAKLNRSAMNHDLNLDLLDYSTLDYQYKYANGFVAIGHAFTPKVERDLAQMKEIMSPENYKVYEKCVKRIHSLIDSERNAR